MKKNLVLLLPCVLLAFYFSACKKCKTPDIALIQNDYVPYSQGSTFEMTASNGRVIHFTTSAYSDQNQVEQPASEEEKCEKGIQIVQATFAADSGSIAFVVAEQGVKAQNDWIRISFGPTSATGTFDGTVSSASFVASSTTTVVAQGSATIGNRTYSDVVELSNTFQLPSEVANHIWYSKSAGLLKVGFTDSTTWTIVN